MVANGLGKQHSNRKSLQHCLYGSSYFNTPQTTAMIAFNDVVCFEDFSSPALLKLKNCSLSSNRTPADGAAGPKSVGYLLGKRRGAVAGQGAAAVGATPEGASKQLSLPASGWAFPWAEPWASRCPPKRPPHGRSEIEPLPLSLAASTSPTRCGSRGPHGPEATSLDSAAR